MKIKDLPVIGITVDVKIPTENGGTTIGAIVPIGAISMYGGRFAPENWAMCDGSPLSIQGNEPLFAVIGNAFGGDSTTFALPDFRNRFPMGAGVSLMGGAGGSGSVTLAVAQMPTHSHSVDLTGAQVNIDTTVTGTLSGATASGNFPATTVAVTGGEVTIPVNTTGGSSIRQTDPSKGLLSVTGTAEYSSLSNGIYGGKGTLTKGDVNIPSIPLNLSVSGSVHVPIQTTAPVTGTVNVESTGEGQPVSITPPYLGVNFIIRIR